MENLGVGQRRRRRRRRRSRTEEEEEEGVMLMVPYLVYLFLCVRVVFPHVFLRIGLVF